MDKCTKLFQTWDILLKKTKTNINFVVMKSQGITKINSFHYPGMNVWTKFMEICLIVEIFSFGPKWQINYRAT